MQIKSTSASRRKYVEKLCSSRVGIHKSEHIVQKLSYNVGKSSKILSYKWACGRGFAIVNAGNSLLWDDVLYYSQYYICRYPTTITVHCKFTD